MSQSEAWHRMMDEAVALATRLLDTPGVTSRNAQKLAALVIRLNDTFGEQEPPDTRVYSEGRS